MLGPGLAAGYSFVRELDVGRDRDATPLRVPDRDHADLDAKPEPSQQDHFRGDAVESESTRVSQYLLGWATSAEAFLPHLHSASAAAQQMPDPALAIGQSFAASSASERR